MPYEMEWLLPRRVLGVRVNGPLALSDIELGSCEVIAQLDSGEPPVHIIIDVSRMASYPVRVSTLAEASTYLRHPHLGWLVIFGVSNFVLEVVISTLVKLTRVRFLQASSRAEALRLLAAQDATVSELVNQPDSAGKPL